MASDPCAAASLSTVIYTQLTDVEPECRGLPAYDLEINKEIPARAAAAQSGSIVNLPEPFSNARVLRLGEPAGAV